MWPKIHIRQLRRQLVYFLPTRRQIVPLLFPQQNYGKKKNEYRWWEISYCQVLSISGFFFTFSAFKALFSFLDFLLWRWIHNFCKRIEFPMGHLWSSWKMGLYCKDWKIGTKSAFCKIIFGWLYAFVFRKTLVPCLSSTFSPLSW